MVHDENGVSNETDLVLDKTPLALTADGALADEPDFQPITPGSPRSGAVTPGNDLDYYTLNVVAGQTYVISLNGTGANAMPDPQIFLYNSAGQAIAADDEGGTGSNALLTYTATATGVVYIEAGAWSDAEHEGIPGDYTLAVAQRGADVSGTIAGAQAVAVGSSTLGFMDQTGPTTATAFNDVDFYKVDLVAGQYYEFQASAGWDYYTGPEGDLRLHVMDGNGAILAFAGDISSSDQNAAVSFVPSVSGTFYLRVSHDVASARAAGASPSSGYELSVKTFDLSGMNPLDGINWGGNDNVVAGASDGEITVYFAKAGEVFDGQTSLGWNAYEQQQTMLALQQYSNVLSVTYRIVDNSAEADFNLVVKTATSTDTPGVLGYFNPPGEDGAGIGVFWRDGFGWDEDGPDVNAPTSRENGGLEQGGYAFYTLVHEFGHAMGLAHPHDNGGGSTVIPGVFSAFSSYGAFDLNQGVYTVMSYNPGWDLNPANAPYTVPWYTDVQGTWREVDEAYNGGLSALDIALLQLKYGANTTINTGDNVYVLPAVNAGDAFFTTLWDAGGVDTIAHDGTQSATIDLTAATIDFSATGAGVISRAAGVYGGFTIAQGTVIENARGGIAADVLIGNSANNQLDGGAGADRMIGRVGDDRYIVDNVGDVVTELVGEGSDQVSSSIDYTLGANLENLTLTGAAIAGTGNELDNLVTGSGLDNILSGLGGNDVIIGMGGNDTLDGGIGNDKMTGGVGNDSYVVDAIGDVVTELAGEGTDHVSSSINYALGANLENLTLTGNATSGTGNELNNVMTGNGLDNELSGLGGNDTLIGVAGNDTLDGGTGNDTMLGGTGDDLYIVGEAGDVVTELAGEGTDTVRSSIDYTLGANLDNLVLTGDAVSGTGNELANVITGNALGNRLNGDAGNDTLIGGNGVDFLTGGAGNDTFVAEINGSKVASKNGPISLDVILDFAAGDKIDLSSLGDFTWGGSGANKNAGDITFKIFDSVNGAEKALGIDIDGVDGPSSYTGPVTMVFGNVDGGAPEFALALIGVRGVTESDFAFTSDSAPVSDMAFTNGSASVSGSAFASDLLF